MFCENAQPDRPLSIMLGDNYISKDYPNYREIALPPTGGSRLTFNKPNRLRHGWQQKVRHQGVGVITLVDGSVRPTKTDAFQQQAEVMFNVYLKGPLDVITLQIPQYGPDVKY